MGADYPGEINLVDPALYSEGDPYEVWRWLRASDPVRWHPPGEFPGFWILTKYGDIRAVYRDPATFRFHRRDPPPPEQGR